MNTIGKWSIRIAFAAACSVAFYFLYVLSEIVLPAIHLSVSIGHIFLSLYLHLYPSRWHKRTENAIIIVAVVQSSLLAVTIILLPLQSAVLFGVAGVFYVIFSLIHFSSIHKYRDALAYLVFLLLLSISLKVLFFQDTAVNFYGRVLFFEESLSLSMLVLFTASAFRYRYNNDEASGLLLEKEQTIDWFSTLVNLVSHNLRSPLASVLGNTQILAAKHPEIKNSVELERITSSVFTSNNIIDRLLKASFVTDQSDKIDLKKSIAKTYPSVEIIGTPIYSYTYEQSVCLHLAIEVFVDNALKYSTGKVAVDFRKDRILVQDLGPGIPEAAVENFASVKNHSVGTLHGIGVPFASRLLESIGYVIIAENTFPGLRITMLPKSTQ